jgi:hypothetical protein
VSDEFHQRLGTLAEAAARRAVGESALGQYRRFVTGATRDTDADKLDVEGFESPLVRLRYAQYMHGKRRLADGTLRDADNWQQGIPRDVYVKSLTRHALDLNLHHDGYGDLAVESLEDTLCALIFNASGLLFEILKSRTTGAP